MSANERQVGGEHYKRAVQHWDLMALANAGYFAGQITKYAERHSKKNGKEDLEKSLHFAEKMHEVAQPAVRVPQYRKGFLGRRVPVKQTIPRENPAVLTAVRDYAVEAGLTALQERIFEFCLLRPDRTEEIVALCRKHLHREYGPPQAADLYQQGADATGTSRVEFKAAALSISSDAGIPAHFVGEGLSPAQEVMKREMLTPHELGYAPGTPEDGGHHALPEPQEDASVDPVIDVQIEKDVNVALAEAIAAQRPEPEVISNSPKARGRKAIG